MQPFKKWMSAIQFDDKRNIEGKILFEITLLSIFCAQAVRSYFKGNAFEVFLNILETANAETILEAA